jgi:serine/threonine protein kinase
MWRNLFIGFTIIIAGQTIRNYIVGDYDNAYTGTLISLAFGWWTYALHKREARRRSEPRETPIQSPKATKNWLAKFREEFAKASAESERKAEERKQQALSAKAARKQAQATRPAANKEETKFEPVTNAARRLRQVATDFEDPRKLVVFRIEPLRVTRGTKAQSYTGGGVLIIKRDGVLVGYSNANSRDPKLKQLDKKWSQVIGVTPHQFEIYFQDHSYFEFEPINLEDFLVLTVFWQVFHMELNGSPDEIINPLGSILGEKLRVLANHLDENREQVLASKGSIDIEKFDFSGLVPYQEQPKDFKKPGIGSVLQGYKLEAQLGEGGFGTVFLGRDQKDLDDVVAFKLMNLPEKSGIKVGSPEFFYHADRFMDEAKKSFNFTSSAYVLNAIEMGITPWPWIAYPLVKGKSVKTLLQAGTVSDAGWWNLAHDLLSGLRSIDTEGLVHLDIKPDNIMLNDDRFTILDLGVASIQGYEFGQMPSGTIVFMAPEVLEAQATNNPNIKVTGTADVFSAGLTLLWCLSRSFYFGALRSQNAFDIVKELREHIQTQGISLPEMSDDKRRLLEAMLQIDPRKRPSANDLLFLVAPHVDLAHKIKQIEEAAGKINEMAREKLEGGENASLREKVDGPFKSWLSLEQQIKTIIEDVKPAYFTIQFYFNDNRESVYIQALYAAGGWVMECMSEKFSDSGLQALQKAKLVNLGWSPPTDSSPNYERIEAMLSPTAMTALFVEALEQAYGISIGSIKSMRLNVQNKNAY